MGKDGSQRMKALVTGAAGFIGSHMCDALTERGIHTVGVDDLSLGRMTNIDHLEGNEFFRFHEADVVDDGFMGSLFEGDRFDIVFHLAANSDIALGGQDPEIDLRNTFMTTFRVLEQMRRHSVGQLIFASSSAIYGDLGSTRISESQGPLFPASHYGAAKLASEAYVSSFSEVCDIQAWIVRFPNVVGERCTHGVIYDFVNKLMNDPKELEVLGDGEQNKPYLYVKELISAIFYVWENAHDRINCFNLGVSSRTKVKNIARMVIEAMELDPAIRYGGGASGWKGDVPQFEYDLAKIEKLGWKCETTSDEAVRKSIELHLRSIGKV